MLDITLVGEVDRPLQEGFQVHLLLVVGRLAVVADHQGVELVARRKGTHLSPKGPAAQCAQIKRLTDRQRRKGLVHQPPPQLGYLNGVRHRSENGRVRTPRHIAAQANP